MSLYFDRAEFRRERSSHSSTVSSPYSHSQSSQQVVPGPSGLSLGEAATDLPVAKQQDVRPYVRKRKRKTGGGKVVPVCMWERNVVRSFHGGSVWCT